MRDGQTDVAESKMPSRVLGMKELSLGWGEGPRYVVKTLIQLRFGSGVPGPKFKVGRRFRWAHSPQRRVWLVRRDDAEGRHPDE